MDGHVIRSNDICMNGWIIQPTNEWIKECTINRTNQQANERMNEWTTEQTTENATLRPIATKVTTLNTPLSAFGSQLAARGSRRGATSHRLPEATCSSSLSPSTFSLFVLPVSSNFLSTSSQPCLQAIQPSGQPRTHPRSRKHPTYLQETGLAP